MSNVKNIDDARPHMAGPVICFRCEREWVSVRPVGEYPLECPSCGAMMGYSWSNVRAVFDDLLGQECCGQKDADGVCLAPACVRGQAMKLATLVHRLGFLEHN